MESSTIKPDRSKILIVDDQLNNIQVLIPVLEVHANYSIAYALSGSEALERIEAINPDLILLDLYMPEMSGLEVCQIIKNNPQHKDTPILFLTASHEDESLVAAFECGAADYVTKPFKMSELLARVEIHLKLRKQTQEIQRNQRKLDAIVNNIKDGIVVVDLDGIVRFANPAAAQMFDKPLSVLIGSKFGAPIVKEKLSKIEIVKGNGEVGVAEITVAESEWEDQPAAIAIIGLRDVSEREES
ncbi:MAG: response regulator [Limnothrix sp.]